MKVLKLFVVILVTIAFYSASIGVISRDWNFASLEATFNLADSIFRDALIAAGVLVVLALIFQILLNAVSKLSVWITIVISQLTFVVAVGLSIDVLTFLDQRLLVVTSALSASAVFLILTTSIIALINQFEYRRQKDNVKDLYKVSLKNPSKLLQKSIREKNFSLSSVSLALSYISYGVFYGRYAEVSLREIITPGTFSLFYLAVLTFLVVGSIQSRRRVLR